MSKKDKDTEITAWRNLWSFVPSEVKYYLLKSGTQVAITMRNYKRHMGILLSTRWDISKLELGVFEKEYDQNDGKYYYERKVIQLNPQSVIDIQWIAERVSEEDMGKETTPPPTQEPQLEEEAEKEL
jgi:hypothetical protein